MNSQSIEFGEIEKDINTPEIVRKSFRIPVEDHIKVMVVIDSETYPVLDISLDGVGVSLDGNCVFEMDQVLKNCELCFSDQSIKGLDGKIVHLSPTSPEKKLQGGIRWTDLSEQNDKKIANVFKEMKKQLLSDESSL